MKTAGEARTCRVDTVNTGGLHVYSTQNRLHRILVTLVCLAFLGCEGGNTVKAAHSTPVLSEQALRNIAEKKIFFGHQSVGYNIMDGVADVIRNQGLPALRITETHEATAFAQPVFAHSRVGKNVEIRSKLQDFEEYLGSGIGPAADVAFVKFCFLDISASSDAAKEFALYKDSMARMQKAYPGTTFLHVTIPLTALQTGPKAWIKRLLGKPVSGYADNIVRNEYNALLRKEFAGREPVYDLAELESTHPDGQRVYFVKDGNQVFTLASEYTDDGGHLNVRGRTRAAEQLLAVLAALPGKRDRTK